jgi:S-adenosylmethionine decarboxylase
MNIIDGLHLMVDGTVADASLFEEAHLDTFLKTLISGLDMQLIVGPLFKQVELDPAKLTGNKFQDEGGLSCYAMISTSHISIHCWPLRRTFMFDAFSCKMFDHEKAMQTIYEFLKPSSHNVRVVVRRPPLV